jgi:hypothetical protein
MSRETVIENLRQYAGFAGILAGFSFTALLQLVALNDKRRIVGATACAFAAATCALLYSMFGFFLFSMSLAVNTNNTDNISMVWEHAPKFFLTSCGGIIALLIGVSLAGWIRSRLTGIITTAVAVAAFFGMLGAVVFLATHL